MTLGGGSKSESNSFVLQNGRSLMSDDTSLRSPQDRTRVAMNQEHEVRYWTERFGVSRDDLQRAVNAVGHSVSAVERHLKGA
jgi:hypothetical protein